MATRDVNGWRPAAPGMHLDGDEVHVWRASLECPSGILSLLEETLSNDERARADRFYFEHHRDRFVRARGVLRCLLGEYLSVDPAALAFEYSSYGKPRLAGALASQVAFNVSHSEDLGLFAFSRRGEIGVDIEAVRALPDRDTLAQQLFSRGETASLGALDAKLKDAAFFRCWTRKEAFVKAIGEGLSHPLDGFEVTFKHDDPPTLRVIEDDAETSRWSLYGLSPAAGFAAALVTEGVRPVRCWEWRETAPAHALASRVGLGLE